MAKDHHGVINHNNHTCDVGICKNFETVNKTNPAWLLFYNIYI